ncbi:MAG: thymidine phosphorylase [Candidatus Marinimicrobia bacterium]|nr:thymidine phosphorylase [Candidatus Neomarinimicrobiota bacterium]MDP6593315.1 thymidine phosphorylase [Candidatus Neomarinimicrobiota bacterium]MDP6836646.1 thymidine phosphorylase [Candidatus Neomarinimicrobiota bacterium]MDP6966061.1 thymidine phosphorylase [Candidatus Neomarinimicrobiota bacterium]
MNPDTLAAEKLNGKANSPAGIRSLIHDYSAGSVGDETMTRWLQAVHKNGMTDNEILAVVDAMLTSGETMDFSHLSQFVADKHSTGGVGDKVSLVLGPLMAAAGLAIPMISGRSLGHTGGTLDKLESIPGYQANISLEEFRRIVETVGISMIGQTDNICPADKKMYALRDRTGTVESIALISGSIMSKKIAEGVKGLALNITVGNGAFMPTLEKGRQLGEKLSMVGEHYGVSTEVVYSDMNQPLGWSAGLWNEVVEAVDILKGEGPEDVKEVVLKLGVSLLLQSAAAKSEDEARKIQNALIESGRAFELFLKMVSAHGGDISSLDNPYLPADPALSGEIIADRSGFLSEMDTLTIGENVNLLTVYHKDGKRQLVSCGGIYLKKKIGDPVATGEVLAVCTGGDKDTVDSAAENVSRAIKISEEPIRPAPLVY